jgi:hypothetical protein
MRRTLLVPLSLAAIGFLSLTPAEGSNMGFHLERSFRILPTSWQDLGDGRWKRVESVTMSVGVSLPLEARFSLVPESDQLPAGEWRTRIFVVSDDSPLAAGLSPDLSNASELLDAVDEGASSDLIVAEADAWLARIDEIDDRPTATDVDFDVPPLQPGDYTLVEILATHGPGSDPSSYDPMVATLPIHVE